MSCEPIISVQPEFKTPAKASLKRTVSGENDTPQSRAYRNVMNIPPSPFLQRLGYGTGVNVYLMERPSTPSGSAKSPWAVKRLNRNIVGATSALSAKRLEYEANVLKKISHPNIIGYRETIRNADSSLSLCMEAGEKSLSDIMESFRDEGAHCLPAADIHKVVVAVSHALYYLHNVERLLHGDIKSHNVLVKGDFQEVKICDFGVSLRLKDDLSDKLNPSDQYMGTSAWSSLETLEDGPITDKADIYSFGCLIYELLTLDIPHYTAPDSILSTVDYCDYESFASQNDESLDLSSQSFGTTPILPDADYPDDYLPYISLMTVCCQMEARMRPSAQQIIEVLSVLSSVNGPG